MLRVLWPLFCLYDFFRDQRVSRKLNFFGDQLVQCVVWFTHEISGSGFDTNWEHCSEVT